MTSRGTSTIWGLGVRLTDSDRLSILLYADDIVLIADSADDLQRMLDCVHTWTQKWRLNVNISKTKSCIVANNQC